MTIILPIALILAGAAFIYPDRTVQVVSGILLVIAGILLLVS